MSYGFKNQISAFLAFFSLMQRMSVEQRINLKFFVRLEKTAD